MNKEKDSHKKTIDDLKAREREQLLKIEELRKTKQVLAQKSAEMKKELEPKDEKIRDYNEKLHETEDMIFSKETTMNRLSDEYNELQDENKLLKDNQKQILIKKTKSHQLQDELLMEIHDLVREDPKDEDFTEKVKLWTKKQGKEKLAHGVTTTIEEMQVLEQMKLQEKRLNTDIFNVGHRNVHNEGRMADEKNNMVEENLMLIKQVDAVRESNKKLIKENKSMLTEVNTKGSELARKKEQQNKAHMIRKTIVQESQPAKKPAAIVAPKVGKLSRGKTQMSKPDDRFQQERQSELLEAMHYKESILLNQRHEINRLREIVSAKDIELL